MANDGDITLVETPRTPLPLMDPRIGAIVAGRYRILERIAIGGMGVVYRGERLGLGRAVAIKFLRSHALHDADSRARFQTEARAASRLSHPNCVPVFDAGMDGDAPFIVMDFVVGRTLREVIASEAISVPRALSLIAQIAAGLAHAHAHGVVHRDIKPDNILVSAVGGRELAQVVDFGLAKCGESLAISRNMLIGTPNYMSPEQTLGLAADARADVYSLGVVMFELLAQQRLFRGEKMHDTIHDTMRAHREDPVPALDDVAPERAVPAAVEHVLRRALAKSPIARYPSASELLEALDAATEAARSETDIDVAELLHAAGKPRWARTLGVAALLSSVIVAVAYVA